MASDIGQRQCQPPHRRYLFQNTRDSALDQNSQSFEVNPICLAVGTIVSAFNPTEKLRDAVVVVVRDGPRSDRDLVCLIVDRWVSDTDVLIETSD